MKIKALLDEDFVNYKVPSMFIGFPSCTFKCEKDCGKQVCQNSTLATAKSIDIKIETIVDRYIKNHITHAIVCGGLEPFDSFADLFMLIACLRLKTSDDIVIYTGYYKEEIANKIESLKLFENIIVKFGRFIPDQEKHRDDVLEVELASNNQYAERIS